MPIVSISMTRELLKQLEEIVKEVGFTGRSEAIRAGVRLLIADHAEKAALVGEVRGVLLLVHNHLAEDFVTTVKHDYDEMVSTHLHSRLEHDKCLDVFLFKGEARDVKEMLRRLRISKKIEFMKLIPA